MAIYQAPKKRWRLAVVVGVVGAIAGLLIGLLLGGGGGDPLAALRDLDIQLEAAAAPLDVLAIHGEEDTATSSDERVVTDAVARTTQRFDQVRDVVMRINADAVSEFDGHVARLRKLARDGADPDEIAEEAEDLADLLRDIVRA